MSPPLSQPFQLPHRLIGNTFYLFYIFSYLNMFFFCLSYSSKLKNCVGLNLFHLCISVYNLHYQSSLSLSLSFFFLGAFCLYIEFTPTIDFLNCLQMIVSIILRLMPMFCIFAFGLAYSRLMCHHQFWNDNINNQIFKKKKNFSWSNIIYIQFTMPLYDINKNLYHYGFWVKFGVCLC